MLVFRLIIAGAIAIQLGGCMESGTDDSSLSISLKGDNTVTMHVGDRYTELGATAMNGLGEEIPVDVDGSVNSDTEGTYIVNYSAQDYSGNTASKKRIVRVLDAKMAIGKTSGNKATATPSIVVEGEAVLFGFQNISGDEDNIAMYEWKDNNRSLFTGDSFVWNDLSIGKHTITLTVTYLDETTRDYHVVVTVGRIGVPITQLKKTGQTDSFDEYGEEVLDGSVADDGRSRTGIGASYTRDNIYEIITDHATGLMWQDNDEVEMIVKPWLKQDTFDQCAGENDYVKNSTQCTETSGDTAATYCSNLVLGGYTDWRVPSVEELMYIADRSKHFPAIDNTFRHVASDNYWSSSGVTDYESSAWYVGFYYGEDRWYSKSNYAYVRCVREND